MFLCSGGRMIMICIPFDSPEVGEHLRYPSHVDLTSRSDSLEAQSETNFQKTQFSPIFWTIFDSFWPEFYGKSETVTAAGVDSLLHIGWSRFDVRSKACKLENVLKTYNYPNGAVEKFLWAFENRSMIWKKVFFFRFW